MPTEYTRDAYATLLTYGCHSSLVSPAANDYAYGNRSPQIENKRR